MVCEKFHAIILITHEPKMTIQIVLTGYITISQNISLVFINTWEAMLGLHMTAEKMRQLKRPVFTAFVDL